MDDIATFADSSGLVIKDGGKKISDLLEVSANLSDLSSPSSARTNLGLGTMAVESASDYLALAGGTMTGTLTLAGAPVSSLQAATKAYVDATAGTAVQSVSGTANRITSTGGVNPVIDISAAYVGQTSITTLGTIGTGTWAGTTITVDHGGTGRATLTNHGVLVGAGTTAITQLGTGSAGQVLQSGGASADPAYSTATFPSTATGTGKILIADGTNWVASTPTYPNTSGTAGKVVISDGTNNVYSTPTFPNASATSRKIIVSDGTNWVASTETWATPSTSGNILTSNGTNWTSSAPNSIYSLKDDFYSPNTATAGVAYLWSDIPWIPTGSAFAYTAATEAAHPGILGNASTATRAGIITTSGGGNVATGIILGAGTWSVNWVIKVATLSTVTNRYTLYCGFLDLNTAEANNGVYLVYSDNLNSGKWVGRTASGGSRNDVNDTGSAVTTAWYNLGATVNAAASSVEFFVNGVSLGTQTSTIPTGNPIGISTNLIRSAGTIAANSVLIDLMYMTFTATTPR